MADWLIVQLPRTVDAPAVWMLADSQGRPSGAPQSGPLSACASLAGSRRVCALAPGSDVVCTQVRLPVRSGMRPQQLVPYALEEQLAADVETLHFAVASRPNSAGQTTVAVVTRALLQEWLASLKAARLTPAVLCPPVALLPENPGHAVVLLEADSLAVRRADQPPQVLPADQIDTALEAALGTSLAEEHLIVYVSPSDWQRRSAQVEALRRRCASLKVQLLTAGSLPLLAGQLPSSDSLNLLTGEFAPKGSLGGDWRRWRLAAVLAVALLALHVGGLSVRMLQLHHSEQRLDQAITRLAGQTVPGGSAADVRQRVEQLLAHSTGHDAGLLGALDALAEALSGNSGASLESLSFQNGTVRLRLKASDAESLGRIDQSLRHSGWNAELTSGGAAGKAYEGEIEMKAPGTAAAPGQVGS